MKRNTKCKGKDNYQGGDFRKHLFGEQVAATNPGPSKLLELRLCPLGPCWDCSGFGHIVANCFQPPNRILVKVVMTCMYVMLYMCQTY